jgi:ABC-2 type transport system permease protein
MRTLRAALLIARNDLRRRLRNRSFVLQALVAPLIMSVLISLAFGSGLGFDVKVGVVTADRSELGRGLRDQLVGLHQKGLSFVAYDSVERAREAVDDGDVGAALVVPTGFQDSLATPHPKAIDLVIDNDQSPVNGAVARAVAESFAARIDAGRLATFALLGDGRPAPSIGALSERDLPISLDQRGTGAEVKVAATVGPGIGLLFLFLSVAIVSRNLFEERRQRVLDRIRAAPVSMTALLVGKAIGVVVLGIVTMVVLWGATSVLLGASWGDPMGVLALIVASSTAVAGIAAAIAGLVRTERSADLVATAVAFVFGILGGSLVPLSALPAGLLKVTYLTPNGWALHGFAELSAGDGGLVDVLPHVGVLLIWAVVAAAIGVALLPRRLGTR